MPPIKQDLSAIVCRTSHLVQKPGVRWYSNRWSESKPKNSIWLHEPQHMALNWKGPGWLNQRRICDNHWLAEPCVINQLDYPHHGDPPFDLPHTRKPIGRYALGVLCSSDGRLRPNLEVVHIDEQQENMISTHQPSLTVRGHSGHYRRSMFPFMCAHIKHGIAFSSLERVACFSITGAHLLP